MKRVHPNTLTTEALCSVSSISCSVSKCAPTAVLTVWRKSLLFNCSGFTVFDTHGNLTYRVDSYSSRSGELVLMDTTGKPLFTSRRKKLNLCFGQQWLVYEGEGVSFPRFTVKKHSSFGRSKMLADITSCGTSKPCSYEIEGSYLHRSCVVYGKGRHPLAEIRQKEAASNGTDFGTEVFRLVVYPGIDTTLAMAIVVLLDQMFWTRG